MECFLVMPLSHELKCQMLCSSWMSLHEFGGLPVCKWGQTLLKEEGKIRPDLKPAHCEMSEIIISSKSVIFALLIYTQLASVLVKNFWVMLQVFLPLCLGDKGNKEEIKDYISWNLRFKLRLKHILEKYSCTLLSPKIL